jgi:hypothetical protein
MLKRVSSSERSADMPIELACESLHPVRCAAYFNASSPASLVEVAMEHGARVHGFTQPSTVRTDKTRCWRS